jgi:hypothetical protein
MIEFVAATIGDSALGLKMLGARFPGVSAA